MKIAILKERRADEARVAASPETVKKLVALGAEVTVERGAGAGASYGDAAYEAAGATLANDAAAAVAGAAVVLKVRRPSAEEAALLPRESVLVALLEPYKAGEELTRLASQGVTAFALELVPRITRAQAMDVLSSQANLSGYKAVLDGAAVFGRAFPMMMTAAGTIPPARVLVMGAGVAGLQAIATARRLGAVVSATDVRPAAKEQVQSLGASFVAVEDEEFKQAETAGGYAKEMSAAYKDKQSALIAETIKKQDMVITTALIPGRPAPRLIDEAMVKSMKPGSVIVDLAVESGGNCALSEAGKVVEKHGVKIVGHANVPSRLAEDASALYARNLFNFLGLIVDKETKALKFDWNDEILKAACVMRDGQIVLPSLGGAPSVARPLEKDPIEEAPAEPKSANAPSGDAGKSGA